MREQKNYRREKVWPSADKQTMESVFFEPLMETKIRAKNRRVREIAVKLQCSTEERETIFGSSYREVWENGGSRNRDSTVNTYIELQSVTQ